MIRRPKSLGFVARSTGETRPYRFTPSQRVSAFPIGSGNSGNDALNENQCCDVTRPGRTFQSGGWPVGSLDNCFGQVTQPQLGLEDLVEKFREFGFVIGCDTPATQGNLGNIGLR